jgi:methenyltetrahydromethanopterin cyclohydrolase
MADKELKIKLAATGGDAAAKEVEKLTEATEALNQETAKTNEGTTMFDWGPPVKEGREEVEAATVEIGRAHV